MCVSKRWEKTTRSISSKIRYKQINYDELDEQEQLFLKLISLLAKNNHEKIGLILEKKLL